MAWKPLAWKNSGKGQPTATKPKAEEPEPEDDDDDAILDPEDDDEDEPEEGGKKKMAKDIPAPSASDDSAARLAALEAENERLRAEATKLQAQLGEQTLPNAQKAARATAVRLFGQGTPQLKQAKDLVAGCETVADAERLTASWELALTATPLAANAGARQTSRPAIVTDPNADTAARAKSAVARTRPRSVKPGIPKEE